MGLEFIEPLLELCRPQDYVLLFFVDAKKVLRMSNNYFKALDGINDTVMIDNIGDTCRQYVISSKPRKLIIP